MNTFNDNAGRTRTLIKKTNKPHVGRKASEMKARNGTCLTGRQVAIVMLMLVVLGMVGCSADRATVDHRAAVMGGVADKINSGTADDLRANASDVAWTIENERRAAVNLSDSYHWRKATYQYPASRPTTLPWKPQDDTTGTGQ